MTDDNYTRLGVKVDKEVYSKLRDYCDKNGFKVYFIVNNLIKEFVEKLD